MHLVLLQYFQNNINIIQLDKNQQNSPCGLFNVSFYVSLQPLTSYITIQYLIIEI